jgi:diacylglycerol kinase (ATP)
MKVLVLQNARSGTASRQRRARAFLDTLTRSGMTVAVEIPASAEAMRERAERARRSDHDVLLVSGGDGTLSAAVNGLVRAPKDDRPAFAVLPLGRGNDFAAEIGIRDEADALRALTGAGRRFIDLGRSEAGVFLGVAGTGFDARAARRARETPVLSGSLLYTYAVLRTLVDYRPLVARVRFDEGELEGPLIFAAAGNTSRYGGGMRITPKAELDDGRLDLCIVREISRATLLWMFPTVFSGRHLAHPKVEYVKTRFVAIETDEPAEVFADGEYLQSTPIHMDVLPRELEVVVPIGRGPRRGTNL